MILDVGSLSFEFEDLRVIDLVPQSFGRNDCNFIADPLVCLYDSIRNWLLYTHNGANFHTKIECEFGCTSVAISITLLTCIRRQSQAGTVRRGIRPKFLHRVRLFEVHVR